MKISVIGAGAFGTSLANLFAGFSEEILILTSSDEKKNDINFHSMNSAVFPGKILRKNLKAVSSLEEIFYSLGSEIKEKSKINHIIFIGLPSYALEDFLIQNQILISSFRESCYLIFCTKGISKTGFFFDEIIFDLFGESFVNFGFLFGPSFAIEILEGEKTFINLISKNQAITHEISEFLNAKQKALKIFVNQDIKSGQIFSMMKNICAIFFGILKGSGAGDDFCAAFFTFFLKEILFLISLFSSCEQKYDIVFSFAGIGDLFLTSTSQKSRNFSFGFEIAKIQTHKLCLKEKLGSFKSKPEGFFALNNLFKGFIEVHHFEYDEIIKKLPLSKKLFDFFDENHENFGNLNQLIILD